MYWYFISNFPKASDLSKNLDKYFGAEREVVSTRKRGSIAGRLIKSDDNETLRPYQQKQIDEKGFLFDNITSPSTPLAKKYEGIKYSVAPLKQTNETIMVFQKPYKTGSCLHDVLAMENGDDTITCGGVDIENNRVEAGKEITERKSIAGGGDGDVQFSGLKVKIYEGSTNGRFPAQTYIDSGASEIIDLQSGNVGGHSVKTDRIYPTYKGTIFDARGGQVFSYDDKGGASRILHKCDYELEDYDLYHYCPKVSKSERNEGLEGFEEKEKYVRAGDENAKFCSNKTQPTKNNHPTVKPKALLSKILKLFKTPNNQILLDPFLGSGSTGVSAVQNGYSFIGFEKEEDYFKIAQARIKHAENNLDGLFPPS